jgi:tetratricopeptide (TPR) repeat protein
LGGQHNEALAVLKKAETLDPGNPIVRFRQAASYFFLRQYSAAAASCDEAIRLAPKYDTAFLLLGMASLERGEFVSAEKTIEQAIALSPDNALYHRELGVTFLKQGNIAGSKKELDRALSLDPRAVEAYYWRARLFDCEGHSPEAIADLETALALQPTLLDAYSELAKLYRKVGQPERAQTILARQNELKATSEPEDRDHLLSDLTDPLL